VSWVGVGKGARRQEVLVARKGRERGLDAKRAARVDARVDEARRRRRRVGHVGRELLLLLELRQHGRCRVDEVELGHLSRCLLLLLEMSRARERVVGPRNDADVGPAEDGRDERRLEEYGVERACEREVLGRGDARLEDVSNDERSALEGDERVHLEAGEVGPGENRHEVEAAGGTIVSGACGSDAGGRAETGND